MDLAGCQQEKSRLARVDNLPGHPRKCHQPSRCSWPSCALSHSLQQSHFQN